MAWRDDRENAHWYADQIKIPGHYLDELHSGGDWTWSQISEQLQKQYDAHQAYRQFGTRPGDLYPDDHSDIPDWMHWYGKHS